MARRPIVVIGSLNMDLVCRTPRLPGEGETILGGDLLTIPGGKGGNQAVAAARLGGAVKMVGRVGDDDFGRQLFAGLQANGVDTTLVRATPGVASGCAMIVVDERGTNSIVVSPGANARVSKTDIDAAESVIRSAAVVVLQLEIPLATVQYAIAMCRRLQVPCILDPAPVPVKGLPKAFYAVDVLTPNEHEAVQLAGVASRRRQKPEIIAATLAARGARRVVLKRGASGSGVCGGEVAFLHVPSFKVKVVDTTAAGDAFTGALAVGMAERKNWSDLLRFANAAGAVCCTRMGAQPALPNRAAVDALIAGKAARSPGKTTRRTRRRPAQA